MLSYHNDQTIKHFYLQRVAEHRAADQLVKGTYWQNGKGCAVGCTVHSGDHGAYEKELGIPWQLARLEDEIFESLPNGMAMDWPTRFLEAIPVGVDLMPTYYRFIVWLLVDPADGVIRFAKEDRARKAIADVADLYKRLVEGGKVGSDEWRAAADAAYAAAHATATAVHATATAAYADAYATVYAHAHESARIRQSEKLLELLATCGGEEPGEGEEPDVS